MQGADDLSPFGEGGLNAYGYCSGDPVNRCDPDGHTDVSHMRRVADSLRYRPQATQALPGQQAQAVQRVNALRQRLRQPADVQAIQRVNRNPLAQPGGEELYARRAMPSAGDAHRQDPVRNVVPAAPSRPPQPTAGVQQGPDLAEASNLYEELVLGHQHQRTARENARYVQAGTEIFRHYRESIRRIRNRSEVIRARLDLDQLRWFHFLRSFIPVSSTRIPIRQCAQRTGRLAAGSAWSHRTVSESGGFLGYP